MPLPLIPAIVAGATAASAAIAGKKGYDSYKNMKETKELAEDLEAKYKRVYNRFEAGREKTNKTFEDYGKLKLEILDYTMKNFVDHFKQIKNIHFKGEVVNEKFVSSSDVEQFILNIEKQVVQASQVMSAGLTSLASGGLAAMGAVGAATTFAAASTGTPIALLSGVAAKNATLAFLGGGALKAGGLGIAGGTAVLGGIALAPALAIGSLIFASSTEKKLEKMYAKKAEVNTEVQKLKSATKVMTEITKATESVHELAQSTKQLFTKQIEKMIEIIDRKGNDFKKYSKEEQIVIYNNYKLAVIIRDILNITILNEDGDLAPNLEAVMTAEKEKIAAFEE